jgi:NitT/TauT family transport system substrate-binding protein
MASRALLLPCLLFLAATGLSGCTQESAQDGLLRLGYFPNLTHAQALYGLQTGLFEDRLAQDGITLEATDFNAGPTAIEALLTGQVDIAYVGPSPTVNGILAAGADKFRIISGAASGGARFIVQPGLALEDDAGFDDRTFASPQLGNTQDVALKVYLADHGHKPKDQGGDVQVINAANPDILTLFIRDDIDGAWVPEPWATRLETEGGGVEHLDERDLWPDGAFVTTHVVTTARFLREHRVTVDAFLAAHVEATAKVAEGGPDVLAAINDGIAAATGKALGQGLLESAFAEVTFTNDPLAASFEAGAGHAHELGLTAKVLPDVGTIYDLVPLNDALAAAGEDPVEDP